MRDVLKTNDPVQLDFAQVLLADAGIETVVFDDHMSVMDGSLGILPRRLMVPDADFIQAEQILKDGLSHPAAPGTVSAIVEDGFLNGKVTIRQPADGFRSGLDAVMLAAAVPACVGDEVLELGAGAGAASLCVATRVPACTVIGIEIDPELAELARTNAAANGMAARVRFVAGDALALPTAFKREFAHVFSNPPFHGGAGEASPNPARARALGDTGRFADWLQAGLKRVASGGTFTTILRADRLGEALRALPERGVAIFPLWPRSGEAAKRIILQIHKGSGAPLELLSGLVLHEADGRYTAEADHVLRESASLALGKPRL